MPTPSEPTQRAARGARSERAPRSVFGNFKSEISDLKWEPVTPPQAPMPGLPAQSLQSAIDTAVARAFLHGWLARAFTYPDARDWPWLTDEATVATFTSAVRSLALDEGDSLRRRADALLAQLREDRFEDFQTGYIDIFGHAARGTCPLNEIEYGDLKADPLFQPHRLADLAAFYEAFGVEMAGDSGERLDHISVELEFLSVLAAKEAYALEQQLDDEELALCRDAQRQFLREHLGRWTPAFTRRLARLAGGGLLAALARFTRELVEADCRRFNITAGSEDLFLRPVDEAGESLCASCGIRSLPPGALTTT